MNLPDVHEARKNICTSLGEESSAQYFTLLKQYLNCEMTKIQFDAEARKLLQPEQVQLHSIFMLSFINKVNSTKRSSRSVSNKGNFETADFGDYISPSSPLTELPAPGVQTQRFVAQEKFLPDQSLIISRMLVTSWENGLESGDDRVAEIIVLAVQMYLKNIVTAMVSKTSSYKLRREGRFQQGVGFPVPNPWLKNTANIIDDSVEPNIDISDQDHGLVPVCRPTLDRAEQRVAFALSCSSTNQHAPPKKLTLKILYKTLFENPSCLRNSAIRLLILEKIIAVTNGNP